MKTLRRKMLLIKSKALYFLLYFFIYFYCIMHFILYRGKNAFIIYAMADERERQTKKSRARREKKNLAKMKFRERYCNSLREWGTVAIYRNGTEEGEKKRLIHLVCTPHGRQLLSHSVVPSYRMEMNSAGVSFHGTRKQEPCSLM